LKSEQKFFFQKKIVFIFENIENQIVEIVEKEAIEYCSLMRDLLHLHFKGNFAL
jgi:hypothetical protein